jgi:hypothetical protein
MYGHFHAMRNRLKRYEAEKQVKRENLDKNKKARLGFTKSNDEFDFPEVSKAELTQIKEQIRQRAAKEKKKQWVVLIITSLSILIIYLLLKKWGL